MVCNGKKEERKGKKIWGKRDSDLDSGHERKKKKKNCGF